MIHYIVQILAFQLLFLVVYDLFLKNETFFTWNRFYLLLAPILGFIMPLIELDFIRNSIPEQFIIQLPPVLIGANNSETLFAPETLNTIMINTANSLSIEQILQLIWLIGMLLSLGIFCFKLYKIIKLKNSGIRTEYDGLQIILLPNCDSAFSFFNSIFLGEKLSEVQKTNILLHEKIHIEQRHSLDLIFFELIRILFWFNPLVYIFQDRMILLQEFTADAGAASQSGKRAYYEELLSHIFRTESVSFINTFFNQSLIKKRILMLQKSKSRKIFQLKYLVLIPVIAVMLLYTACSGQTSAKEVDSVKNAETEVMDKINELAEAIMKKGDLTDDELSALKFLSQEYKEGDKVYTSVGQYLEEKKALAGLDYIDESNTEVNVPFTEIDKVPVFPGCEGNNEELKKCMINGIANFVGNEFNTKTSNKEIKGRQRIKVQFTINKLGKVANVKAMATFPELETEAKRVVSLLPEMIPGEHDGKKVGVQYALPIIFEMD